MCTIVLVLYVLTGNAAGITNIPGFCSMETCAAVGEAQYNRTEGWPGAYYLCLDTRR